MKVNKMRIIILPALFFSFFFLPVVSLDIQVVWKGLLGFIILMLTGCVVYYLRAIDLMEEAVNRYHSQHKEDYPNIFTIYQTVPFDSIEALYQEEHTQGEKLNGLSKAIFRIQKRVANVFPTSK